MKKTLMIGLAAAAVCALALPAAAQTWGGGYGWGHGRGDSFDYPEFRGEIAHVRSEIGEGLQQGWLEDDDARRLGYGLRRIQWRELREFDVHGWNLPPDDQASIRANLDALDRQVDEARDAAFDGGVDPYGAYPQSWEDQR